MSEHEYMDDEGNIRKYVKRRMTARDLVGVVGGVLAIFLALGTLGSALAGAIPDMFGLARADDLAPVEERLTVVEGKVDEMALAQQESLELQLMSRLDAINDQINTTDDMARLTSLRQSRNELEQRLKKVRTRIDMLVEEN